MNALFRFLGVLGLALFSSLAQAQGFPSKPITLIVPWPPGGSSDLHMRAFAEIASKHLGQPIIVENKPGTGTSPHLLMEIVGAQEGIQFLHVPFKGNADSTQALMGGHIMAQSDATGWAPHVDSGRFRLLVTFGDQRTKRWPSVPTSKELGQGIVSYSPYGIVGPKGMDPAVVKVLHDAFKKALYDPEHIKVMDRYDQPLVYLGSEDYTKWAEKTFREERALIERLGLLAK